MRISDWSSDVCSSDLQLLFPVAVIPANDVTYFGVFCHSRDIAIEGLRLSAGAIDRLYDQIVEFERGNAAQVDGPDFGPIGTNAISEGLRSACLTELMVDLVRVDRKSTRLNSSH